MGEEPNQTTARSLAFKKHSLLSGQADISYSTGWSTDTREGWPLLTVETAAKGDL
jgi:hypothetical protein